MISAICNNQQALTVKLSCQLTCSPAIFQRSPNMRRGLKTSLQNSSYNMLPQGHWLLSSTLDCVDQQSGHLHAIKNHFYKSLLTLRWMVDYQSTDHAYTSPIITLHHNLATLSAEICEAVSDTGRFYLVSKSNMINKRVLLQDSNLSTHCSQTWCHVHTPSHLGFLLA